MATDKKLTVAAIAVFEEMREERGVSYRDIEARTGINRGTISRHLSGKHSLSVDVLQQLCAGADINVSTVLSEAYKRL